MISTVGFKGDPVERQPPKRTLRTPASMTASFAPGRVLLKSKRIRLQEREGEVEYLLECAHMFGGRLAFPE